MKFALILLAAVSAVAQTLALPPGTPINLIILGAPQEASSTGIVTPTIGPPGFVGKVIVKGTGAVTYDAGGGVYFSACCLGTNNADYKFTGALVGSVFGLPQGQISFVLRSRHNFADLAAGAYRQIYDVRDAGGHKFSLSIQKGSSNLLVFSYMVAGQAMAYYVPSGTEDKLFGSGVVLDVAVTWNGTTATLYLNGAPVKTAAYTPVALVWDATSIFDLGAYEYQISGAYDVSDDVIGNFLVTPSLVPITSVLTPPAPWLQAAPPQSTTGLTVQRWTCSSSGVVAADGSVSDCAGLTALKVTMPDGTVSTYYGLPLTGTMPPVTGTWTAQ